MMNAESGSTGAAERGDSKVKGVLVALFLGCIFGIFEGGFVSLREEFPLQAFGWPLLSVSLCTAGMAAAFAMVYALLFRRTINPTRWAPPTTLALVLTYQIFKSIAVIELLPSIAVRAGSALVFSLAVSFTIFVMLQRLAPQWQRKLAQVGVVLALLVWALPLANQQSAGQPWQGESEQRPANIIFIVIDTLRADHLSSYGYEIDGKKTSPNLDVIASSGTLFRNAYAQAPWTRPSVASLMSGLYPQSHGVATPFDRLSTKLPTMPVMLDERGYQCAAFSANPQVSPTFGFDNGFDYFWSISGGFQDLTAATYLWKRGLLATKRVLLMVLGKYDRGIPDADADRVNREIRTWLAPQSVDVPRFLYLHYLDPHDPYEAPEDLLFNNRFATPMLDEGFLYAPASMAPFPLDGHQQTALEEAQRLDLMRRYDAEIRFVDDRIGKQLQWMEERGFYRPNADYLVITSDHGEEFYEHNQWLHGRSEFQEMVNVPLLIKGPKIPPGSVVEMPVQLIDILPTVASWTGAKAEFKVHGTVLPFLEPNADATAFGKHFIYSHRPRDVNPIDMIRSQNYKLIVVHDGDEKVMLLYDLKVDPGETRNLMEDESMVPDDELRALMNRMAVLQALALSSAQNSAEKIELSPAMKAQLKALGYLEDEPEN
ncbi:MAG: sulfatase-like hydrolase/transferase [Planctomycetes bacterium]|nr:sulfatase-like hydrolase/transferase [Planctomycetota bacterium]